MIRNARFLPSVNCCRNVVHRDLKLENLLLASPDDITKASSDVADIVVQRTCCLTSACCLQTVCWVAEAWTCSEHGLRNYCSKTSGHAEGAVQVCW
jgi:serine/threonine protein kinase